jgi:hypothetical protein
VRGSAARGQCLGRVVHAVRPITRPRRGRPVVVGRARRLRPGRPAPAAHLTARHRMTPERRTSTFGLDFRRAVREPRAVSKGALARHGQFIHRAHTNRAVRGAGLSKPRPPNGTAGRRGPARARDAATHRAPSQVDHEERRQADPGPGISQQPGIGVRSHQPHGASGQSQAPPRVRARTVGRGRRWWSWDGDLQTAWARLGPPPPKSPTPPKSYFCLSSATASGIVVSIRRRCWAHESAAPLSDWRPVANVQQASTAGRA